MNKSILLSIRPEHCFNITSGAKTEEVRKAIGFFNITEHSVPFKVYMYCTKGNKHVALTVDNSGNTALFACCDYRTAIPCGCEIANGKVLGEFICDRITEYESEFLDDFTYENIKEVSTDDDGEEEFIVIAENGEDNRLCRALCLTWDELRTYIGTGDKRFYSMHISNLVIYDTPKELYQFERPCPGNEECTECKHYRTEGITGDTYCQWAKDGNFQIQKAPQSWCYVREITNDC